MYGYRINTTKFWPSTNYIEALECIYDICNSATTQSILGHARVIKNAHLRTCREHLHFAARSARYRTCPTNHGNEKANKKFTRGKLFEPQRVHVKRSCGKQRRVRQSTPRIVSIKRDKNYIPPSTRELFVSFVIFCSSMCARELFFRNARRVSLKLRCLKMTGWPKRHSLFFLAMER